MTHACKSSLRLAIYLSYDLKAGGGFNQALNAIDQAKRLTKDCYELEVFTTLTENIPLLNKLGIKAKKINIKLSDKWVQFCAFNKVARILQKRLRVIGSFERLLIKNKINLVYFVEPGPEALMLQELNHITTIWDNCHRDYPEFPEVRKNYEFFNRESIIKLTLAKSIFIICDSFDLVKKINFRYGIDLDRLFAMPFSPSSFLSTDIKNDLNHAIEKYQLTEKYFFYPAQFWAHKNHIRIVQAFKLIEKPLREKNISVVFCGGDKGVMEHIRSAIKHHELNRSFKILGFVPPSDMVALYKSAIALIMPTYFGPTNLPPLEAWQCGIPVIYSKIFSSQVGDAAIMVDPDSAESLSEAMLQILEPECAMTMVERGFKRLRQLDLERNITEKLFVEGLRKFEKRLECWKKLA